MAIKGIIFDFDGLIIDTESPEFKAWKELFRSYNVEFPMNIYWKLIGHSWDDTELIEFLGSKLDATLDYKKIYTEFKQQKTLLIDQQPLRDGVLDYLQSARKMGIKIGLASSAIRDWVDYHLKKHKIYHYFNCIKTREDVSKPKPDPDLFSSAVECIGIEPHEAIAFEDSYNGVVSAKKAGLFTVVVPNSVTKISDFKMADYKMEQLSDMPLDRLIDRFQNN